MPQPQDINHQPAPQDPRSSGSGIASLVLVVLVIPSAFLTILPSLFVALFTRPDEGSGDLDWAAIAVFWSLPVLFGVLCLILAIPAVRRSVPQSNSWSAAVAALWILGSEVVLYLAFAAIRGSFRIVL